MEAWKDVPEYNGVYIVSDHGDIRRTVTATRHPAGMLIKKRCDKDGYHIVNLYANGKRKNLFVHTIVLSAFCGKRPDGMEACHNDGNRTNNCISNLRWDTRSANMNDRRRHRPKMAKRRTRQRNGANIIMPTKCASFIFTPTGVGINGHTDQNIAHGGVRLWYLQW